MQLPAGGGWTPALLKGQAASENLTIEREPTLTTMLREIDWIVKRF